MRTTQASTHHLLHVDQALAHCESATTPETTAVPTSSPTAVQNRWGKKKRCSGGSEEPVEREELLVSKFYSLRHICPVFFFFW
ncbi:hypothetical protein Sjap_024927 [Stephania japonica]|uniref:Uncharacterized protein n=1 Tax=Stephania japonica TaxID=461633 RepID=A0AAP0EE89_9MAGN